MAGESRGELAEAIAKVAVGKSLRAIKSPENVFWEERLVAAAIMRDSDVAVLSQSGRDEIFTPTK